MTLNNTIEYINLALNYPSITYAEVSLYFDMAIAELNTTLHTSIPKVSEMIDNFKQKMSKTQNSRVHLTEDPEFTDYTIPVYDSAVEGMIDAFSNNKKYFYSTNTKKFYIQTGSGITTYTEHDELFGFYLKDNVLTNPIYYKAAVYGEEAFWVKEFTDIQLECDLKEYLPDDWVLLWLIPYVCFKYTVRDGGTASTFAEELTQGFQQLQETYGIPSKVNLATYADKEAYTSLVEANLPNLNVAVPTKAIYESMKHSRITNAVYGSMYDRGGFND